MTAPLVDACAWDDDPAVRTWRGLPRLDRDRTADACVVGLGGSGLAAVGALLERGLDVVGVEAGRVAAGAAGRNGGFLLGGPASFIHHALKAWGPGALDLYRATLVELDRLSGLLGPDVIQRVGSIRLAGHPGAPASDEEARERDAELADCAAHAQVLRANGLKVEAYEGKLGKGLFLPDDGAMNPARRALGLAALYSGRAALYEHSPVCSVAPGLVTTAYGSVRAPLVIVAVDGRLETVLPALAGRVRSARLQMLGTAPILPRRLPCPIYCRGGYDYAQQGADGRLFVGGGRDRFLDLEWTHDITPTRPLQDFAEKLAVRMAGRPVEVTHRWGASVAYTADGRPLCMEVEDGVFACGAYNGTGNLVGPVAVRAAVAAALDRAPVPDYFSS